MHKKRADQITRSDSGDRECHCCSSRPPLADATLTLGFWVGAPVDSCALPALNGASEQVLVVSEAATDRVDAPASPPPRVC